ncbi:MAG: YafY family transcriptional regulator [Spirochaetes bacterium]|nr:YafY family transcriptional regulator [Spirochaetota bacterium]MBU1079122.1 YafY family transcriptional regulator [Spirochaetota bacterium]
MKVDRLISIILTLLDRKRIGAQELAEMYEVSPRTIYRDIDAINMAGVPVRSTSGAGGGFEIMREYKIDRSVFSAADLSAILMGLSGLSSMMRSDELANALAKVKNLMPAGRASDIELRANQVYIDLSPWLGEKDVQPYLEIIKTALRESRLLSFEYADRHGNRTARTAEPYQLVLKGGQWYWQGYCHAREDFRLFKLSRMAGLRIRDERFKPREFKNPQLGFADILPTVRTMIKIRVHDSIMDRILDYCADDSYTPDGDEHRVVSFPFIENDYYYDLLLSFGKKCECLEPSRIRAELKRRIHEIAAVYDRR